MQAPDIDAVGSVDEAARLLALEPGLQTLPACLACLCRRFPGLRELHLTTVQPRRGGGTREAERLDSESECDVGDGTWSTREPHTAAQPHGGERLHDAMQAVTASAASVQSELSTFVWRAQDDAHAGLHLAAVWLAWLPALGSLRSLDLSGAAPLCVKTTGVRGARALRWSYAGAGGCTGISASDRHVLPFCAGELAATIAALRATNADADKWAPLWGRLSELSLAMGSAHADVHAYRQTLNLTLCLCQHLQRLSLIPATTCARLECPPPQRLTRALRVLADAACAAPDGTRTALPELRRFSDNTMSVLRVRGRLADPLFVEAIVELADVGPHELMRQRRQAPMDGADMDVAMAHAYVAASGGAETLLDGTGNAFVRFEVAPKLAALRLAGCHLTSRLPWDSVAATLTSLELHCCSLASPDAAASALGVLQRLQRLRMTNLKQERPAAATHSSRVALGNVELPDLTSLDLRGSPDMAASPQALAQLIARSPLLESIDLSGTGVIHHALQSRFGDAPPGASLLPASAAGGGHGRRLRVVRAANTPSMLLLLSALVEQQGVQLEELDASACLFMTGHVLRMLSRQTRLRRLVARGCLRALSPPQARRPPMRHASCSSARGARVDTRPQCRWRRCRRPLHLSPRSPPSTYRTNPSPPPRRSPAPRASRSASRKSCRASCGYRRLRWTSYWCRGRRALPCVPHCRRCRTCESSVRPVRA